jgi:ADP-ribosylglycohydrolase
MSRRDRFVGCILGQCLGDALGFVVEGRPPALCASYVEEVLRTDRLGTVGRGQFPFGQYTDDSQLARELLESLVSRGGWDPEDYARRVAAIFAEDRIVGRGQATMRAAGRLRRGATWTASGEPAPNAGNGTAMRAAPVGLVYAGDPAMLAKVAHEQGFITHQDPRCSAGSIAIASAVASALDDLIAPEPLCARIAEAIETYDAGFADEVRKLPSIVSLDPKDALAPIRAAGLPPGTRDEWPGISPFVVGSVLWSLYAFLRHPDDYWEAVLTAIAVGGDVDTTAAMTGAIAGAYLGRAALPDALVARLEDQGTWREAELTALAERALKLGA